MNILVFDVPAEESGALTVLMDYYQQASRDKGKTWYFIIGLPALKELDNVKILRFPWVKRSWFHRFYFDHFVAPRLVKKYRADEILSLQNVTVPHTNVTQTLFVHQAIPFSDINIKITSSPLLWVYQNVIGRLIVKSIQKADKVLVQTKWMKDACVNKAKVTPDKIRVIPPGPDIQVKEPFALTRDSIRTFFYPASGFTYKNHKLIVDAALLLKEQGIVDYKVIFTLQGTEYKHIQELYIRCKEAMLPIEFIGVLKREQVFNYYSRAVLLFPSYLETFGLPLLEAKLHNSPILASDCVFSHEVLADYEKADFFGIDDAEGLAELMRNKIETKH